MMRWLSALLMSLTLAMALPLVACNGGGGSDSTFEEGMESLEEGLEETGDAIEEGLDNVGDAIEDSVE